MYVHSVFWQYCVWMRQKCPPKQKFLTAYILPNIFSLYQARHIMADTLMMPLRMRSLSVACGTLTQQSATAVRRSWVKLSEKVWYHEVICGSPINCGQGTTDTKLQRRPALTPAHRWGWNILVWVVIDKCQTETTVVCVIIAVPPIFLFILRWADIPTFSNNGCSLLPYSFIKSAPAPSFRSVPDALARVIATWWLQQRDESWDLESFGGTI